MVAAMIANVSLRSPLRIYNSQTIAMVYVWTVDFDLQNDVSEGSHKLFRRGAKMLGACEESIGATRSVCTTWRWNTFSLSERRRRRRTRRAVGRRNGPSPTEGYFI